MRSFSSIVLIFAISGCGSDRVPTYPVSGRVQFSDGSPVRHGTIEFESVEHGTTAAGSIQHDGSFVLGTYTPDDGAAAGQHKAIIVQLVIADGSFKHTIDHGKPVPVKYSSYESSGLSASVNAEQQNDALITIDE